jgi:septal ring factor EnvC (AmiA/AmiB activator)
MTDEDVKKISRAFDDKFKLLLAEIARIKREVSDTKTGQFRQYTELSKIGKDITVINSTLEIMTEEFGKQSKKLVILWEQVEKVTFGLDQVKETLDSHSEVLKRIEAKTDNNHDNIHKLNKRVITTEGKLGIAPPPELSL